MSKSAPDAFTLVELLVVMAIMSIIGIYTLSNFKPFGEDQNLKSTVLDIQSLFRQAQTNAASGVKCQGAGELGWRVVYTNSTTLDLQCQNSSGWSSSLKTLSLTEHSSSISIVSIAAGNDCGAGASFAFAPLAGSMTASASCGAGPVTITVRNSKIAGVNTKTLKIDQGGRIYEQ